MSNPNNLGEAVKDFREKKDKKKRLEEELTALNKEIEHMARYVIPPMLEDQGIDTFRVPGVGTIFLKTEQYASVLAESRPELHEWLRQQGDDSLIQETVHHATLNSYVKEKLEACEELPEFIRVESILKANLRRS